MYRAGIEAINTLLSILVLEEGGEESDMFQHFSTISMYTSEILGRDKQTSGVGNFYAPHPLNLWNILFSKSYSLSSHVAVLELVRQSI